MAAKTLIAVANLGLGDILRTYKLTVPPNQREYSWTDTEVTTLLQDLAAAIQDGGEDYFLGTIVVVQKANNVYEIVDGQQRLATTALLLAAIRDYLRSIEATIAESIDRDFLSTSSQDMRGLEPRIQLNLADNEFFDSIVTEKKTARKPSRASHHMIQSAYFEATKHVKGIVSTLDVKKHGDALVKWVHFIRYSAQVVMLTISSDGNAYRMFETLNDRGLKTTQADLVKNYLFGRAGKRIVEAQDKWAAMRGVLEALDEDKVPTVTFLRHAMILKRGYFRQNVLHDTIQLEAKSESEVISLLDTFEGMSAGYCALFNPESEYWNGYPDEMSNALRVLNLLNIESFRPLMAAVASKFSKKEAAQAFRKFVSWKVRFLIAGATLTGGFIEVPLAAAAKKVADGEISDSKGLSLELLERLPTNERFESAFSEATVSKASLARYYLRSLEMVAEEQPDALFIPNEDSSAVNLEHILPQKPLENWPSFSAVEAKADAKRIGNLALMENKKNSDLKSAGFAEKKEVFRETRYSLTSKLADLETWNHEQVVARQAHLAKLALKAWPL